MKYSKLQQFKNGAFLGLPIALGYLPVSFSFGMVAVSGGIAPIWAIIISLTNLTSAGQFAGAKIIIAVGSLTEMAITTFVINLRYMLMSLSLTQKTRKMSMPKKLITAFGVTDEIFAVASTRIHDLTFPFMMGLIIVPYIGWATGTALGAFVNNLLPQNVASAMSLTLYAMFIAIIIPAAKKEKSVLVVLSLAVGISCILYYAIPTLSSGWAVIIAAVLASALGAFLFPKKEEDNL